mmetsp:Transcript_25216/g.69642  ORF Transcript_25216/g.69642 Transcript_25216/m.69642 type:complete len:184 (+) Transcript_25216:596-1147(+)
MPEDRESAFGLVSALAIMVGGMVDVNGSPPLVPPPRYVSRYRAFPALAILQTMDVPLYICLSEKPLRGKFVTGQAILDASQTFYDNLQQSSQYPSLRRLDRTNPTPQQIVQYMKRQLSIGTTWDNGLRQLYAVVLRFTGQIALAYQCECTILLPWRTPSFESLKTKTFEKRAAPFIPVCALVS